MVFSLILKNQPKYLHSIFGFSVIIFAIIIIIITSVFHKHPSRKYELLNYVLYIFFLSASLNDGSILYFATHQINCIDSFDDSLTRALLDAVAIGDSSAPSRFYSAGTFYYISRFLDRIELHAVLVCVFLTSPNCQLCEWLLTTHT